MKPLCAYPADPLDEDHEDLVDEGQVPDGGWSGEMGEAGVGADQDDHMGDDDSQGASENQGYEGEFSDDGTKSSFYAQCIPCDFIIIALVLKYDVHRFDFFS